MRPDWTGFFESLHTANLIANQGLDDDLPLRLERARQYIDQNYCKPIHLDEIARRACFSRYHFLRLFRREFDETPHRYLTRQRIERAKQLLVETDLPVTEVCLEVGFQSLGSFSSLFSRQVGHSPNRYRARLVQSLGIPLPPAIPACFLMKFAAQPQSSGAHLP